MSTPSFEGLPPRPDGVRPRPMPATRIKEARRRVYRSAHEWPARYDRVTYGVLDPHCWPSWTSDVRIALVRKGR